MEPFKKIDDMSGVLNAPKQFCENTLVGSTPDFFIIGMATGQNVTLYGMTPEGAKRFSKQLAKQVSEYESKFRSVQDMPDIPSPITKEDLDRC